MPYQTDNYMNNFVNQLIDYIPNIIGALVILLLAMIVSAVVSRLITTTIGDTQKGKLAIKITPLVILFLAIFMIMNQLRIAPEIVTITYAGVVATVVLAFGLGGKDVASKLLLDLYESGKQQAKPSKPATQKSAAKPQVAETDTEEQRAHSKELYSRPE